MIIIAKKNNNKFIVELTEKEMYNVLGYSSEFTPNAPSINKLDSLADRGSSIQISEIYEHFHKLNNIQSSKKFKEVVSKLEVLADAMRPLTKLEDEINKILNPRKFKKDEVSKDSK